VALGVLLALYTFAHLDRYVLTLLVDPVSADFGVSDFQISLLVGLAFIVSFSFAAVPIGWAVDRFSRRLIILAGVAVWSISTLLSGASRSFAHLLACRLGVGAGEAALNPAAYSLLGDLFPSDRLSRVLSIYSLGALVGGRTIL
jgi:MFS family permease